MTSKKLILLICSLLFLFSGCGKSNSNETEETTYGIDVARYQGTIDWAAVAGDNVDFAMIRVGYRSQEDGSIVADPNARYNMQEASRNGIPMGVYFFSTAINEEEALEEANWVIDYISQYPITYPVVYDCEGFRDPDSRQYGMTNRERTDLAILFMDTIAEAGYTPMFYGAKNEMAGEAQWDTSRLEKNYKIWIAQYPDDPDPETDRSSYEGEHHMWQYTCEGQVAGIPYNVDKNVAYFGYKEISQPKNPEPPEEAYPDVEATMTFEEVNETVTAKIETNLRSQPSQESEDYVMYTLVNGETATRIGVSPSGWSKLLFRGQTYYALTDYLTTDMNYVVIETPFTAVNDRVTAKEVVNLRNIPSYTSEDSVVIAQLKSGEVVTRTGINEDVGWSRVEYNGQILYCITSYLKVVEG